jgi:hypothetical protein
MPVSVCHWFWGKRIMCASSAFIKARYNPHVLAKYAAHVTSASFGAVTDTDLKL